jgi:cell division septation protein DedD
MIEISFEKKRIIKSLNELEKEFKSGNIPKSHYISQKRQLSEQLETLEVADRVRKLQGKETAEVPVAEGINKDEEEELFNKFITPPGLKEKNIKSNGKNTIMGRSPTTIIAAAILAVAFIVSFGLGLYAFNIPSEVSSAPLFTNDTAFPPFVLNNTTNSTNSTNMTKNVTKNVTVTPVNTTVTPTTPKNTSNTPTSNNSTAPKAAGSPTTTKKTNINPYSYVYDPNTGKYYDITQ